MTPSLENELYTGRFDDGLLDLFIGLGLVGVGVTWLTGSPALSVLVPAVLIPLWIALRRQVTEPRLGRVSFSADRRASERARAARAVSLGTGVLALVGLGELGLRRGAVEPPSWTSLAPLIPAALLVVGLVLVSLMVGARRFLVYAAALLVVAGLATRLGAEPGTYMTLAGALLSVWAGGLVARFLAAHPNLDQE